MVGRALFASEQFTFTETPDGLLEVKVDGSVRSREKLLSDLFRALSGTAPKTHCLFGLRSFHPEFAGPLLALANHIDWRPVTDVTFNEGVLSAKLPPRAAD